MSITGSTYPGSAIRVVKPVIVIATALFVVGCAAHPKIPIPSDVAPFGRNVTLIYVPGIGGYGHDDHGWVNGIKAAGYSGKTEIWDWTGKLGPISALWAHARQRTEARRIADRVLRLRSESPARPLMLVGHSAGAGLVVMALEDLPPDLQVDGVVLLAPALSRTYDLTRALRHVRGRADVFYSERDTLVLALGTFFLGTVDGVHGEAAGHGGFVKPSGGSGEAYAKLIVHPYSDDRRLHGDDGGHEGILKSTVAAAVVAPLLPGHELHQDPVAQTDAHDLP
jgi:pimeloyl-ACP methyl ester carboxylesterase